MNTTNTATTHTEWAQVIDKSAQEGMLYHFNGGQAYMRDGDDLIIVDMTQTPLPSVSRNTGEFADNYFANYDPRWQSERIAQSPLTPFYAEWQERNYPVDHSL